MVNTKMKTENQEISSTDIKILLIKKKKPQTALLPILREKYPELNIQQPHLSMALNDNYPDMLNRIREVINEI